MSTEQQPEISREAINRRYYENNREKIIQRAKENYAKRIGRPLNPKPGRKPGVFGSYKQKWIEEGQKMNAQAPQEQLAAEEIN